MTAQELANKIAISRGYKVAKPRGEWNGYEVFGFSYGTDVPNHDGYMRMILVKDGKARESTTEEYQTFVFGRPLKMYKP